MSRSRILAAAAAAALTLAALSGCSGGSGASAAETRAAVQQLPGVQSVSVKQGLQIKSRPDSSYTLLTVRLKPGYRPKSVPALTEYLLRAAWAVRGEEPKAFVQLDVRANPEIVLRDAMSRTPLLKNLGYVTNGRPGYILVFSSNLRKELGDWPGPLPQPTGAATAGVSGLPTPTPSLTPTPTPTR